MKLSIILSILFGIIVIAYPAGVQESVPSKRQLDFSVERDELSGPCKPVTLIFARGTVSVYPVYSRYKRRLIQDRND